MGFSQHFYNHNDVGSIILYKGSKPLLIDIGVETYTKTTFSEKRYTLPPMQSGYHNLVNFPPIEQKAGARYKAKEARFTKESASLDLTDAYEGIALYRRSVEIDRKNEIIKKLKRRQRARVNQFLL